MAWFRGSLKIDAYFVYTGDVDFVNIEAGGVGFLGRHSFIGEFEQMVMLALVRLGDDAYAVRVLREIERQAGRRAARGALYRTLDRLEGKGYVEWSTEDSTPARGGHPRRIFRVTDAGLEALRASREALLNLWSGIEAALER